MNAHLKNLIAATGLALLAASNALADSAPRPPAAAEAADATDMADGEVRKVDPEAGKVTLRHGEIKHLDMPAMTMVFVVKDRSVLATLKPGDKVRFRAVLEAGQYTVTELRTGP